MTKYLFIFLIICVNLNAQFNSYSESSSTIFKVINGKKVSITTTEINENGKKSKKCVINNYIDIDCETIDDCIKKNDCNDLIKTLDLEEKNLKNHNIKNKNDSDVFIKLSINKNEIYIGEQISCISEIYIKDGVNINNTNIEPISFEGFWEDEVKIDTKKRNRKIINDKNYTVIKYKHSILTSQKIGNLVIPNSSMKVELIQKGRLLYTDFFGRPQYENTLVEETLSTSKKEVKVKKLPDPKPKNFYGTVSEKFSIETEIDRDETKTSEAISLKIKFRGKGNINMLQPFKIDFPDEFEVFDPIITDKTYVGNTSTNGSKIFEYVIIPRKKGQYTIPSISFSYFNPKLEKYIDIETKSIEINVLKGKQYVDTDTTQYSLQKLEVIPNSKFNNISFRKKIYKYYSIVFWIFISLVFLTKFIAFILSKRVIDTVKERKEKSNKIAIKRLKNAQKCIKNNDFDMFFEEIEKSIWGYFADKFNIDSSNLSKENIDFYFTKNLINDRLKNQFIVLLQDCEFARYAPKSNHNKKMQEILNQSKEIIIEVESNLKKN